MPFEVSWGDLRTIYETGVLDLVKICKMCKVSPDALMRHIKAEKWKITSAIDLSRVMEFETEGKFLQMVSDGTAPSKNDFRARIAARVEKMLALSDNFAEPVNDRAAAMRLELLDKIQKVGERAYGLDDGQGTNVLINLGALKQVNDLEAIEISPEERTLIESGMGSIKLNSESGQITAQIQEDYAESQKEDEEEPVA